MNTICFKSSLFLLFFTLCALASCESKNDSGNTKENNRNEGELSLYIDEAYRPLFGTMEETYETIYPKVQLSIKYIPQEIAFRNLLEGKTDLIIVGRPLNQNEIESIKARGLKPKVNQIASDAIAFIVSENNPLKVITKEKIKEILAGDGSTKIICDKSNSGNLMYLKSEFGLNNDLKNIVAAGNDSAVIEYVTTHQDVIGVIGMSLISDYDDKKVKNRLSKINVLTVQYTDSTGVIVDGYPVQEELFLKKYPFIRGIFVINLDGQMNLGTGFANFLVSERGQRIVLKQGLLPYTMPTRNIIINNKQVN